jgi:hypothetical protein
MSEHLRRIASVAPQSDYRLAIAWDSGPSMIVSLADLIKKGGVFEVLKDREKFSAARVDERQRVIEWPEPRNDQGYPLIEIDADALYERGRGQGLRAAFSKLVDALMRIAEGDQSRNA